MRRYLPVVLLAACASAPSAEPRGGARGLRASEHLDEARRHDEISRERASYPQATPMSPGYTGGTGVAPWYRAWDTTEHDRLAQIHRSQAAQINADFDEACAGKSLAQASESPLEHYLVGGWNTATGVIIYLSPDVGDPDALLAAMRCHRAAMMVAPMPSMDQCPLDMPGLMLDARGDKDGVTVSLAVRDEKNIAELQRRAAREVEMATARHGHAE